MDDSIYVIVKCLFYFALEVWFSIFLLAVHVYNEFAYRDNINLLCKVFTATTIFSSFLVRIPLKTDPKLPEIRKNTVYSQIYSQNAEIETHTNWRQLKRAMIFINCVP